MITYKELLDIINNCAGCPLHENRINVVPGEGTLDAKIMFVGEGPGRDEDLSGRPFVGAAGQLLDKILNAVDIPRESIYITNIVKCRPKNNRNPNDNEAEMCINFLRRQVAIIHPKMIVCLGAVASRYIIGKDVKLSRIRGEFIERKGYSIFPTYHPAALLHNPGLKQVAWEDFKKIKKRQIEYE